MPLKTKKTVVTKASGATIQTKFEESSLRLNIASSKLKLANTARTSSVTKIKTEPESKKKTSSQKKSPVRSKSQAKVKPANVKKTASPAT